MKKKILISTGGSGGHVIPAITIYDHLKSRYETLISTDIRGLNYIDKENYKSIITNFSIENLNGTIEDLSPELRIYNQPNIITSEADIKTTLLSDKFIVVNYVQNQDYFNVRYQVKPFMLWIWISVILISFGGIISFFKKNYEK